MFSWKKILGVFLCLVIIGLSLSMAAGCGKKPAGAVKIGILLPLSGASAAYGEQFKAGIQYVLDEIEQAGGIKSLGGAPIDVVWADDEGNPQVSATEMERLMTSENVSFVIGPFLTGSATGASPLSDKYKIPSMSLFAISDQLAALNLTYWRTLIPGKISGGYGADMVDYLQYLIDNYGVKHDRIAIVMVDNPTGRQNRAAAIQRLGEYGLSGNIVFDKLFDYTAADMTPYALQAKEANPDVFITYPLPGPGAKWVKAMYDIDFYPPIVIGPSEFSQIDGGIRTAVTPELYDKVFGQHCSGFGLPTFKGDIPIESCSEAYDNIKAWCQASGEPFFDGTMFGAQAMYALWDALEDAGSAEPEAINEAFHRLSISEEDPHFIIPVFAPALEWETDGIIKNYTPMMTQIQDGVEKIVWPETIKQAYPHFYAA